LMNEHGMDVNAALDQSSRGANDSGVDAWYYDEKANTAYIYQSKLSESRQIVLSGLADLKRASSWIEKVIVVGQMDTVPAHNHCLFNLYTRLATHRDAVRKVQLVLLSPFDSNDLEDDELFIEFERAAVNTQLNQHLREHGGHLRVGLDTFNLDQGLPQKFKVYSIPKIPEARMTLRRNAHLDVAFVSLYSLVELYRQRGDVLFDKNVRMSLMHNKEARERLVSPMESTFDQIAQNKISPAIFPFYHLGVTISAASSASEDEDILGLEAPSIINGCQTIAIATEYLRDLEQKKDEEAIKQFKEIKVVAKVVVGTTTDELKEITNSNNRQNPIENWQLFCNDSIHIELEAALKEIGVFYERQKGKFDSVMRNAEIAKHYWNTNGTYLRIMDLAQVIALSRSQLQWAAKPSDIFVNKENHDRIFSRSMPRYPRDMVFVSNVFKAMKRGLNNYLDLPAHVNSNAPVIFKKQIIRHHVYRLALVHFYQNGGRADARAEFCSALTKIANVRLIDNAQVFYSRVVLKTRTWYTDESKDLTIEISKKKVDNFFENLAIELGLDPMNGPLPFTPGGLDGK
jgi:AIPR protein